MHWKDHEIGLFETKAKKVNKKKQKEAKGSENKQKWPKVVKKRFKLEAKISKIEILKQK
jgi:hypothetical protein